MSFSPPPTYQQGQQSIFGGVESMHNQPITNYAHLLDEVRILKAAVDLIEGAAARAGQPVPPPYQPTSRPGTASPRKHNESDVRTSETTAASVGENNVNATMSIKQVSPTPIESPPAAPCPITRDDMRTLIAEMRSIRFEIAACVSAHRELSGKVDAIVAANKGAKAQTTPPDTTLHGNKIANVPSKATDVATSAIVAHKTASSSAPVAVGSDRNGEARLHINVQAKTGVPESLIPIEQKAPQQTNISTTMRPRVISSSYGVPGPLATISQAVPTTAPSSMLRPTTPTYPQVRDHLYINPKATGL